MAPVQTVATAFVFAVLLFHHVHAQELHHEVGSNITCAVAHVSEHGVLQQVNCSGEVLSHEEFDEAYSPQWWFHGSMVLVCVVFAGLMSGLTLGLLSLDKLNLEILLKSGSDSEKAHAQRILPIIARHHLLLVTLLLSNAAAMECLPIFLEKLVPPFFAVILSVTLVLFFGEVIPQALCARYGLAIGANLFWLVWGLIFLTFPISFPISKLLDCLLGEEHGTYFRRAELKELVSIHQIQKIEGLTHGNQLGKTQDGLTEDEVKIIRGTIELRDKKAKDCMLPVERVFTASTESKIDKATVIEILKSGHSRIPIYRGTPDHMIGVLLTKTLVRKVLEEGYTTDTFGTLKIRPLPTVTSEIALQKMLNLFKTGKSHMALVVDDADNITIRGIITLEDVVEELIQSEIWDEKDVESGRVIPDAPPLHKLSESRRDIKGPLDLIEARKKLKHTNPIKLSGGAEEPTSPVAATAVSGSTPSTPRKRQASVNSRPIDDDEETVALDEIM